MTVVIMSNNTSECLSSIVLSHLYTVNLNCHMMQKALLWYLTLCKKKVKKFNSGNLLRDTELEISLARSEEMESHSRYALLRRTLPLSMLPHISAPKWTNSFFSIFYISVTKCKIKRAVSMAQEVEYLHSTFKALGSIPRSSRGKFQKSVT